MGSAKAEQIKATLLASGCWPFIKQRPYAIIADPNREPKAIFVSAHATAPLAADYNFTLKGKEAELQAAVTALSKLTKGKVHVGVSKDAHSPFTNLEDIVIHRISGPHPSGNVGTLINKIDPINNLSNQLLSQFLPILLYQLQAKHETPLMLKFQQPLLLNLTMKRIQYSYSLPVQY